MSDRRMHLFLCMHYLTWLSLFSTCTLSVQQSFYIGTYILKCCKPSKQRILGLVFVFGPTIFGNYPSFKLYYNQSTCYTNVHYSIMSDKGIEVHILIPYKLKIRETMTCINDGYPCSKTDVLINNAVVLRSYTGLGDPLQRSEGLTTGISSYVRILSEAGVAILVFRLVPKTQTW